jgi:hypothetical protein
MKNYILVILIVSLTSILSCGRRVPNYHFNGKILLALGIDTGSVFVYQDSITNEIDTLIVTRNDLQTYNPINSKEEDGYTIDIRKIRLESKNKFLDSSNFDIVYDAWARRNTISIAIPITTPDTTFVNSGMRVFEDNFITREFVNGAVNYALNVHDNMSLKGNSYNTVYENLLKFSDTVNLDFCHTFFSPEPGLIKFRFQKGNYFTVKELIYSSIKKL